MGDWNTSDRKQRLPRNWLALRRTVLERDKSCACRGCPRCTPVGCNDPSTDADHVTPGDDHSPTNLAGKCSACHRWKSAQEGVQARGHGLLRRRPAETHPGSR